MKFSSKIRYGIRAMIEIAKESSANGIYQKDIAEKQSISVKYLDQIISSLKANGLVVNVKGKKSGYVLAKDVKEITMLDIYTAFEGEMNVIDCLNPSVNCGFEMHCQSLPFWTNLNGLMVKYFETVTLDDLMKGNIPSEVML